MINGNEVKKLKTVFPDLRLGKESSTEFIWIRGLVLPEGCDPEVLDGLVCSTPRDGYPTRLYLSQKILHGGPGKNWNANGVQILGKSWWAVSWRVESRNLLELVQNHLRAFSK